MIEQKWNAESEPVDEMRIIQCVACKNKITETLLILQKV